MTVKEIARLAAALLQMDDAQALINGYGSETDSEDTANAAAAAANAQEAVVPQGGANTVSYTPIDEIGAVKNAAAETVADDPEVKILVECVNLAARELAGDGFALYRKSTVTAEGGMIPLSAFDGEPTAFRGVYRRGERTPFTVLSTGLSVPRDGEYAVEYAVMPKTAALGEDIELGALCDVSVAAYLTARNYCLIVGRTDEAAIWDQRYCAESEKRRMTARHSLPRREWR